MLRLRKSLWNTRECFTCHHETEMHANVFLFWAIRWPTVGSVYFVAFTIPRKWQARSKKLEKIPTFRRDFCEASFCSKHRMRRFRCHTRKVSLRSKHKIARFRSRYRNASFFSKHRMPRLRKLNPETKHCYRENLRDLMKRSQSSPKVSQNGLVTIHGKPKQLRIYINITLFVCFFV